MFKSMLLPVLLFSSSLFAGDIYKGTLINLKINKASQVLRIDYPGQISGVCGLTLASTQDLWLTDANKADLAKEILIADGFSDDPIALTPESSDGKVSWTFASQDSFVTNIHIKTLSGKTLKAAVTAIVGRSDAAVLLQNLACKNNPID